MKIPIECPVFRTYLQNMIPDAFSDGLMDSEHEWVKGLHFINLRGVGVSSIKEVEFFENLRHINIRNNPKIKHLPKLSNTIQKFFANHEFEASEQPFVFFGGTVYVLLDCGDIVYEHFRVPFVDFNNEVRLWHTGGALYPFLSECEAYLLKIKQPNP